MKTQTLHPKTKDEWLALRLQDVTSTEISALYGYNPYCSSLELWHQKKKGAILDADNEFMAWGRALEKPIASQFATEKDWDLRHVKEYIREPKIRMGSSFDFFINEDRILEIKNVSEHQFREKWFEDNDAIEAPLHIEMQVQQQLALTGFAKAYIGALIGGNRGILLERVPNPTLIEDMKIRIHEFWVSIEKDTPPTPDYERDARFIIDSYSQAEKGKIISLDEASPVNQWVTQYNKLAAQEKEINAKKAILKAQMLGQIKDAEKVLGPSYTISASITPAKHIEYDRKEFRNFRVYMKKENR